MQRQTLTAGKLIFVVVTLISYLPLIAQQTDTTQTGGSFDKNGFNIIYSKKQLPQKTVTVTGSITDAATGRPLQGITVRYKNISAAITDSTGHFTLKVPDYSVAVVIEGETYQAKEIVLKGRSNVSTGLYEDSYTSL